MPAYTFIVNPAAGRYRGARAFRHLQALLAATGVDHRLILTEKPGHGVELAFRAAESSEVVVAVGGDGTVQEVATGLIGSGRSVPMGVLPLGSGNDFVKMIGMPLRVGPAVAAILTAHSVEVDYGLLRWSEGGATRQRVFVNAVGIGFDASVAARILSRRYLPGVPGYVLAVLQSLATWGSPHMKVTALGSEAEARYEGALFLACAGNGRSSGGGFLLTPDASIEDGLLDLCIIQDVSVWRVLQLLPGVFKGRHVTAPEVSILQSPRILIETQSPVPVHADGEVVTASARRMDIEVHSRSLAVLSPK